MAFAIANMTLIAGPVIVNGVERNIWMYRSSTDAIATIRGAGYFVAKGSTSGDKSLNGGAVGGDWVFAEGSDASALLAVTDAAGGRANLGAALS